MYLVPLTVMIDFPRIVSPFSSCSLISGLGGNCFLTVAGLGDVSVIDKGELSSLGGCSLISGLGSKHRCLPPNFSILSCPLISKLGG
jgi:hypothetical protein